jgi:hypothetical protein
MKFSFHIEYRFGQVFTDVMQDAPQNTVVIPAKAPNPWLQASLLPGASRYVPSQMDS